MRLEKTKAQRAHESRVFRLRSDEQKVLKKLGRQVLLELAKRNKTVESFAKELGVARSTLREIIAGRSNARFTTLRDIARGFGYKSVTQFLGSVE